MAEPRFRPLAQAPGAAVLDAHTGLVWEAAPAAEPVPFEAAARDDAAGGWRLPTISELMRLLSSLPAESPFPAPGPGTIFWSSTESPFAAPSRVRAVGCEPSAGTATRNGPLLVVRLLDKRTRARVWRVRDATDTSSAGRSPDRERDD